jgi:hypothetical protein
VKLSDTRLLAFPALTALVDVIYNSVWLGVAPLTATKVIGKDGFTSYYECDCANFGAWSGVAYVYHALLLLYGVFLAGNTTAVPHAFNESKLLAWTLYNSAVSGLAIPVLYVFVTEPSSAYAVKTAAILYATMFACICMVVRIRAPPVLLALPVVDAVNLSQGPRIYYVIFPPPKAFFQVTAATHGAGSSQEVPKSKNNTNDSKRPEQAVELVDLTKRNRSIFLDLGLSPRWFRML